MSKERTTIDVNAGSALTSAFFINAVGGVFYNAMPTFLGSLAESFGFDEQQLGFIASAFLLGTMLSATSGIFWMRRVSWRRFLLLAFILTTCAYVSCLVTNSLFAIVIFLFFAGCANGVFYSIALLSISDTRNTERNFAFCIVVCVLLAAVGLYAFPVVNRQWGFEGVIGTLIIMTSLVLIELPWFPDHGTKGTKTKVRQEGDLVYPVFIGIVAMAILFIGLTGIWAFIGRMADTVNIDPTDAGTALAICMVLGAAGAFLASIIGNRFGNVKPLWLGTACIICGIAFLVNLKAFLIYFIAGFLIQIGWNFALPFQLGTISKADKSGRFVPLITTAMGSGATIGPSLAGAVILSSGYGPLCVLSIVIISVSAATFTWLIWFNKRM
jgi:predicted MFS family arabinose efflux permease